MRKNLPFLLLILSVVYGTASQAQSPIATDSLREANILIEQDQNKVKLSADTPPLIQIPGAPEPFYTYFWEFGDGSYSMDEAPEHTYENPGEQEVHLQVTNNYDNGKAPPSRPKKVTVNQTSYEPVKDSVYESFGGIAMLKNREPVPNEQMVVTLRYENTSQQISSGKLYVYYNENKFRADNFKMVDVRTHHGERTIESPMLSALFNSSDFQTDKLWVGMGSPAGLYADGGGDSTEHPPLIQTLDESEHTFRDRLILEFGDMRPNEQRNFFMTLETTPDMLKDTSAIIKVRGIYVPDRSSSAHKVEDLEMEITTSHDPNKMAVSDTRLNYRFAKNKKLKYKIRFQNNGEGPASKIRLDVDVPEHLDQSTLEVLDMHPPCPICPDGSMPITISCLDTIRGEKQMSFVFRNIYLPGSNQPGVSEYDSTKGFVKYKIALKKDVPKKNTVSRTAIIFDKNEPILTNYSKSYFKPGISIGAVMGYTAIPSLSASRQYYAGATIAPYKPDRGYLQAELLLGKGSYESQSQTRTETETDRQAITEIEDIYEESSFDYLTMTLIPISYRYNLANFVSFGAGIQFNMKLKETEDYERAYDYYIRFEGSDQLEPNPDLSRVDEGSADTGAQRIVPGAFVDVNLGLARIGPSAGFRYSYLLNQPNHQWSMYLIWRF
ncbi:PKD domain-containing protein [Reichenbachiella sp. MSK19-1]|uniref:PKD domain-containing protein n=1 Tax=Reichenbachiella sp. MSK19-1 TaxID=1897631 RepID=UPI000E6C4AD0|nr:PKD domain-containing protein [Reichenbachiella sp. MSK19-1]RJE72925.1 hypothetical protein BGP76_02965 [Reichenbachiella sp. MSK19-1]